MIGHVISVELVKVDLVYRNVIWVEQFYFLFSLLQAAEKSNNNRWTREYEEAYSCELKPLFEIINFSHLQNSMVAYVSQINSGCLWMLVESAVTKSKWNYFYKPVCLI